MQILKEILECTTKPIIYDGDTGGISEHFVFMVRKLEMNGIDFLADTNALIYLLNGKSCMRPFLQNKLAFSVISEMELL